MTCFKYTVIASILFELSSCSYVRKSDTIRKVLIVNRCFECVTYYDVGDSIAPKINIGDCIRWSDCKTTYHSDDSMIVIIIGIDKSDRTYTPCELANNSSNNHKKEHPQYPWTNVSCFDSKNAYVYMNGRTIHGYSTLFDGFALRDSLVVNIKGMSVNIDSAKFANYCATLLRRMEITALSQELQIHAPCK